MVGVHTSSGETKILVSQAILGSYMHDIQHCAAADGDAIWTITKTERDE